MHSVCLFINWRLLLKIILLGSLCSFYTLSLKGFTNTSTTVFSIVTTKCVIFENILYTTKIALFIVTNSKFVIKFTIKSVYSCTETLFAISILTSSFIKRSTY